MRLIELGLLAFGPFADVRLDFTRSGSLHLIYGPNEAGKSTALRAIANVLYGIPVNTQDAHRHAMPDLRISARLADANGTEVDIVRRKGSKNTLLDVSGNPIGEDTLASFLAGVDEGIFRAMFGLNHVTLREGAEALLHGKGAVGESLFAAAIGGPRLHALLRELENKTAEVFKRGGKNPKLNEAIKAYAEAEKRSRDAVRSADAYRVQQEGLSQARADNTALAERRRALGLELSRLQRAQRVLPLLTRREQLLQQRATLGTLPRLAPDAGIHRARAQAERDEAARERERLLIEIADLTARKADLRAPESILAVNATLIEALQNDLGRVRAAANDLPRVRGELGGLENQAATILRDLGRPGEMSSLDALRVSPATQARIRALAQERSGVVANREHAQQAATVALEKSVAQRGQLAGMPPAPDMRALQQALQRAQRLGEIDDTIASSERSLQVLNTEVDARLAALPLWKGDEPQLRLAQFPALETIERYRQRFEKLSATRHELGSRRREIERRATGLVRDVDELQLAGAVPTEEELEQQRARREVLWRQLSQQWGHGAGPEPAVVAEYETAVRDVDHLADRLRREANRVATLARLMADRRACASEGAALEREASELARAEDDLAREWTDAWASSGIQPLDPSAMAAWISRLATLLESIARRDQEASALATLTERRTRHRQQIRDAMTMLGSAQDTLHDTTQDSIQDTTSDDLASAVERAEEMLHRMNEAHARRRTLADSIQALESEQPALQRRAAECDRNWVLWQQGWEKAVAPLGLPATAAPEEALAVLDQLSGLFAKVEQMTKLQQRIQAMESDARRLAEAVGAFAREHAPALATVPAIEGADELLRLHRDALDEERERARLDEELRAKGERLRVCEESVRQAAAQLTTLMQRAAVDRLEELEPIEQAAADGARLDDALRDLDEQLAIAGEGASAADLREQTRGLDPDAVKARIAEIEGETEDLVEEQRVLHQHIGSLEAGILHLENAEGAADAAADAQEHLASIRAHVRTYLRLRLATTVIRQEVEGYRERNQGPLIERANVLFPRLTLGKYAGVRVGFDAADEPVLRCLTHSGQEVGVEHLSDGTRDQLYLALRVATLEHHAQGNQRMPVVLDDILVHFDDERTSAALSVLGELATQTQVLLFTHHARVVELARATLPQDKCVEHVLTRSV